MIHMFCFSLCCDNEPSEGMSKYNFVILLDFFYIWIINKNFDCDFNVINFKFKLRIKFFIYLTSYMYMITFF